MKTNIFTSKDFVIFSTRDYAQAHDLSISAASKQLGRRKRDGLLVQITRGIWANTNHLLFTPLACVPYLLGKEQGYISFLTALHRHGLLSQIPTYIQIATTGHCRKLKTPVGVFEFIQIKPELMSPGTQQANAHLAYFMANPEKALIDTFYISTRKSNRFIKLPELDLRSSPFRIKNFYSLLNKLKLPIQIKKSIQTRMKKYAIEERKNKNVELI